MKLHTLLPWVTVEFVLGKLTVDSSKGQRRVAECEMNGDAEYIVLACNAYPRLVLALCNLIDVPTDDNHAGVRIELRRTARLLLSDLGELKVCQHGSGHITSGGWQCSACGEVFARGVLDMLPANAWPGIPEFLKRKTS